MTAAPYWLLTCDGCGAGLYVPAATRTEARLVAYQRWSWYCDRGRAARVDYCPPCLERVSEPAP